MLPHALRAAVPLLAGHGVVLATGFLLQAALVAWAFRDRPDEMARIGLLSQALQWVAVAALAGMPSGLLRFVPAQPADSRDLLATARTFVLAAGLALASVVAFVGPVRDALVGEADASHVFATYVWRVLPLTQIVLSVSWLHAGGKLRAKATAESAERVFVLGLALAGAVLAGIGGYAAGSIVASCVGLAVAWRVAAEPGGRGRVRRDLLGPLLRVGAPQLVLAVLEAVRPLVVLRLATRSVGDVETGLLATAMGFSLPLIALPEFAAQALFPGMHGPEGEGTHVRSESRRVLREVLVAGIVFLAVYAAVAAWLLPQAGTGRYAGAVLPLVAILPGVLAHGVTSHAGYVLLVRDRLVFAAAASGVSVVAAGVLGWVLIPAWGAAGGGIALSCAGLLRAAIVLLAARRE